MNPETEKLERLITMAQRLTEAMQADIDALKSGNPQAMRSLEPDVQKLLILYGREAQALDPSHAKAAPPDVKKRLSTITAKFRETVSLHQRLLTRVRNASEGIVKAVADEVQRRRAPTITYAPAKAASGYRKPNVAMIYNGVV